jgi:hypothetical protein
MKKAGSQREPSRASGFGCPPRGSARWKAALGVIANISATCFTFRAAGVAWLAAVPCATVTRPASS